MGRKRKLRRAGLLDNQPKVEEKDEPKVEKTTPAPKPVVVQEVEKPAKPKNEKKSLLTKLLPSEEE